MLGEDEALKGGSLLTSGKRSAEVLIGKELVGARASGHQDRGVGP